MAMASERTSEEAAIHQVERLRGQARVGRARPDETGAQSAGIQPLSGPGELCAQLPAQGRRMTRPDRAGQRQVLRRRGDGQLPELAMDVRRTTAAEIRREAQQ
jgi:hypothetical protein